MPAMPGEVEGKGGSIDLSDKQVELLEELAADLHCSMPEALTRVLKIAGIIDPDVDRVEMDEPTRVVAN